MRRREKYLSMEKLTAFDRKVLAAVVRYEPCESPFQAAVCCLTEMGRKTERAALNASFDRLCAAGVLRFEEGVTSFSDEVLLASRARLWQDGAWEQSLSAALEEKEYDPASLCGKEYLSQADFCAARRYGRKMYKLVKASAQTPAQKRGWEAFAFLFSLAACVLFVWLAVKSAFAGDYDNTFAAVGSFIFMPCAIYGFAALARQVFAKKSLKNDRKNGKKDAHAAARPEGQHGDEGTEATPAATEKRGGAAVAALCALSALLHAAFFAALIPLAWHHVFGLVFVLAVSVFAAWLLFFFSRPSAAKLKKKIYPARTALVTRNIHCFADGADIFSDEERTAERARAAMNVGGAIRDADIYRVSGKKYPFYVAITRFDGISAVGFLRARDANYIFALSPYRAEDAEKNEREEHGILCAFAEESAKEEKDFSYSPDFLLRGFICLQGEKYCVRLSAPFFMLSDLPAAVPPEGSGISAVLPDPEPTQPLSWESAGEIFFEHKENADEYLRAVLAEADTLAMYAIG